MVTNVVIAESQHEALEEQAFWPYREALAELQVVVVDDHVSRPRLSESELATPVFPPPTPRRTRAVAVQVAASRSLASSGSAALCRNSF